MAKAKAAKPKVMGAAKGAAAAPKPKFGSPAWNAKYGVKKFGKAKGK